MCLVLWSLGWGIKNGTRSVPTTLEPRSRGIKNGTRSVPATLDPRGGGGSKNGTRSVPATLDPRVGVGGIKNGTRSVPATLDPWLGLRTAHGVCLVLWSQGGRFFWMALFFRRTRVSFCKRKGRLQLQQNPPIPLIVISKKCTKNVHKIYKKCTKNVRIMYIKFTKTHQLMYILVQNMKNLFIRQLCGANGSVLPRRKG